MPTRNSSKNEAVEKSSDGNSTVVVHSMLTMNYKRNIKSVISTHLDFTIKLYTL